MNFKDFCKMIRDGIATGRIRTAAQPSELDLAIQYAIGREQEERGSARMIITPAEVSLLIKKYCGRDVYARVALGAEDAIEAALDAQMRTKTEVRI